MTSGSQEDRAAEARRLFYSYRFHDAYHIYARLFSTLPFAVTPLQMEHLACFARTLIELGRLAELKFYIPVLERHYKNTGGCYLAYALGYSHFLVGSQKEAQGLFEYSREHAKQDVDLRIKSVLMLARLATAESDCIHLVHSIKETPTSDDLAKLLEVWRCIVMRYQGDTAGAIQRLKVLLGTAGDAGDKWYLILSVKDALVRSYLKINDFSSARTEIEGTRKLALAHKLRTVSLHTDQLNQFYKDCLGQRTILKAERRHVMELILGHYRVQIRSAPLRQLVCLFETSPVLSFRKLNRILAVGELQLNGLLDQLLDKMMELQLPADCLERFPSRVQLIPVFQKKTLAEVR